MKNKCKHCKYWKEDIIKDSAYGEEDTYYTGRCHRYPVKYSRKQLIYAQASAEVYTLQDSWCGEFKKKKKKNNEK